MTTTIKNIIPRKKAEAAQTNQYTAVNCKTVIDKFTVTNTAAVPAVITVNLIASGGSALSSNVVLSAKSIAAGQTYTCPELVGQSLEPGGVISTLASDATSLTISSTGREIT